MIKQASTIYLLTQAWVIDSYTANVGLRITACALRVAPLPRTVSPTSEGWARVCCWLVVRSVYDKMRSHAGWFHNIRNMDGFNIANISTIRLCALPLLEDQHLGTVANIIILEATIFFIKASARFNLMLIYIQQHPLFICKIFRYMRKKFRYKICLCIDSLFYGVIFSCNVRVTFMVRTQWPCVPPRHEYI